MPPAIPRPVVGVCATLVLVIACQPADLPGPAESQVVIGSLRDVHGWNPYLTDSAFSDRVMTQLYPTLAIEQPDYHDHPPTFSPNLARSWTWSEDGRVLRLELEPEAHWSDGIPVTAADVVFSHRVAASEEIGWYGGDFVDSVESVEAIGDHTVRVRFSRRDPYAFMDLNDTPVVPAHAWGEIPFAEWYDTDWSDKVISAGPFTLARHRPRQEIVLTPNPGYWKPDRPRLERVVFRIVPSKQALVTQLMAGEIDVLPSLPEADAGRVRAAPGLELLEVPDRSYLHVVWNLQRSPTDQAAVRAAAAHAVDREAIIEGVYRGFGRPSAGPILSDMWAFDPELAPPRHDPETARRMLAAAGWVDTDADGIRERDGEELRLELMAPVESEDRQDVARLIKADLEMVGCAVEIRTAEWGAMVAELQNGDFDGVINRWTEPTKIDLGEIWRSPPPGEPTFNYGRYANPEVDRLIGSARELTDFAAQRPLWIEAQRLIAADHPYLFLVEGIRLVAVDRRVRHADINSASVLFNLESWEVEGAR